MQNMNYCWKHKIVHDTLYGSFYLPEIAWVIIDTIEFQRLRNIKQTGHTSYVYPGAEHTRFQHCLGVAHLAEQLGKKLRYEYPTLVSEKDHLILCLAGLCHDLGHCAYSHLYDDVVIPFFTKAENSGQGEHTAHDGLFKHEHASYYLLLRIYQAHMEKFKSFGLDHQDIALIGKIILGSPAKIPHGHQELVWTPEDHRKRFMFDIISNERTGSDVDKFDYLARDSHYTGIGTKFDSKRLMEFAHLVTINGQIFLEYESGAAKELIASMWETRDDLHRRVYQHRVVKTMDAMMSDIICQSGHIIFYNEKGIAVPLSRAHQDMSVYIQLDDTLINVIRSKTTLSSVLATIDRIKSRKLWKTIATISSTVSLSFKLADLNLAQMGARFTVAKFTAGYRYYILNTQDEPPLPELVEKLCSFSNISFRKELKSETVQPIVLALLE